eukprot:gene26720-35399_t
MEAMDHTYTQQLERDCVQPLKELNAIVSDVCVRRDEWEAAMIDKLKPLQAAVGNLQQSLQQQEAINTQNTSQLFEQLHKLEDRIKSDRFKREINEGNVLNDMSKVEAIVDGQMRTIGETLRLEIVSDNKEEFSSWRRNFEDKIEKIRKANEDNSEKQAILKLSLAELSEEIAKSLAKKLDRKEFKANAKKKDSDVGQPTPITNSIQTSSVRQPDFVSNESRDRNSATNNGTAVVTSSFSKEDRGRLTEVAHRIEELEKKFVASEKDKASSILKSPAVASSGIPQWQLAVGDLTLRLRDEIQRSHEKEKEYLTQLLQDALLSRDKKISTIQSTLAGCALQPTLTSLDKEVVTLKSRVSGEILGARFLWTNNSSAPGEIT